MPPIDDDIARALLDIWPDLADSDAVYTGRDGIATKVSAVVLSDATSAQRDGEGLATERRGRAFVFAASAEPFSGVAEPQLHATLESAGLVWAIDRPPRRAGPLWECPILHAGAGERGRLRRAMA